jgi:hypothetical protein
MSRDVSKIVADLSSFVADDNGSDGGAEIASANRLAPSKTSRSRNHRRHASSYVQFRPQTLRSFLVLLFLTRWDVRPDHHTALLTFVARSPE